MSDEMVMAKVNAFAQELKELGVEDFIFAAGSSAGLLAIQYDGDPRGVCFLAMSALMNAMFDFTRQRCRRDGRWQTRRLQRMNGIVGASVLSVVTLLTRK